MKKIKNILFGIISIAFLLGFTTGCVDTTSTDENGNEKNEFTISETAQVNDTEIKINSVKKVLSECMTEYNGECLYETTPDNAYFLVIDLTIENMGDEEISISSMMSFDLKDETGEQGEYEMLTENISSQLDGNIMSGDILKGQIAFDVKESEYYNFYYQDSLIDDSIKFIIKNTDIIE